MLKNEPIQKRINEPLFDENLMISATFESLKENIKYHEECFEVEEKDRKKEQNEKIIFYKGLLRDFSELKTKVENINKELDDLEKKLDSIDEECLDDKNRIIDLTWFKKCCVSHKKLQLKEIALIKKHLDNDPILVW